ncbi:MAG: response regulator [Candidatus Manganitrophaceae bacterium]
MEIPRRQERLLIVDDEASILFAMREYFTLHGFEVDCADEKGEAEMLLKKECYAAVIADLRMSGIDSNEGLDIVRCVRKQYPSMRIIILTAYGSPEIEAEARCRGADAFLSKPRPLREVARILFDLLGIPYIDFKSDPGYRSEIGSEMRSEMQ